MKKPCFLKPCLAFALGLLAAQVQAQVSPTEREALIDFYHATGGEHWHDNQGWLSGTGSECSWFGVQCAGPSSNQVVLRLMLAGNNLIGQIPESLADLDHLETLVLRGNDLEGSLPADLWGLANLSGLYLSENRLTGAVPAAILGMPAGTPITRVDLADNLLDRFAQVDFLDSPSGAGIELTLDGNLLTELPPAGWRETGAIATLNMANNRIEGELTFDGVSWPGLLRLKLSDNAISELTAPNGDNLPDLLSLDVSGNRIEALPESLTTLETLTFLDASNNWLTGPLPDWFGQLNLVWLGLDNNDLSGPIERVFAAMDLDSSSAPGPHSARWLHAANNRFSGPLPEVNFSAFNTPFHGPPPDAGLDLCFNDIELPDDETLASIDNVHRGLALAPCLGRDQTQLDLTISGSWFAPWRAGEGLTQMMLDNGQMLSYWFTYVPDEHGGAPEQMWVFGLSNPGQSWSEFRPLWITSHGRFDHGLMSGTVEPSPTWMRQNRLDADNLHFFYTYHGQGICITGACFWDVLTERFDLTRLSHLAGTSCDNQTDYQQFSGAWFNPERDGEGFIVEMLPDDRALVYWFTYQPDNSGKQAWMTGEGHRIQPGFRFDITPLYQPQGAVFGPDFDSADVELVDWGGLTLEFHDDTSGQVSYESHLDGYGSGSYSIERLARPMLAECGDE